MKTFVFFIGGTGARVLRSLTMLMASGVSLKDEGDSIVPLIVDFDTTNADLKRSNELMAQYNVLHEICDYHGDHFDGGFFKAPLGIENNGKFVPFKSSLGISFEDDRSTFGRYVGYDSMDASNISPATKKLLETLYDDSSSEARDRELNLAQYEVITPNGPILMHSQDLRVGHILKIGTLVMP